MTQKDDIQGLISRHNRHRQKLKEKQALYGLNVEPRVLIEIEDTEAKIVELEEALAKLAHNEPVTLDLAQYTIDECVRSPEEQLDDFLAQAVAAYEAGMYQTILASSISQPYKFLYPFEIADTDIFFGRDAAVEALYQTVFTDRLTVLHAPSGAGKTSLLKAGLASRLIRQQYMPIYARAYRDPLEAVKLAIAPASLGPWPDRLATCSLAHFLRLVLGKMIPRTKGLVIILDQFEEFFINQLDPQPFAEAVAGCWADGTLPVRFVIGIRHEYFARLADLQPQLPHIFHNHYPLKPMSRFEASSAITGPMAKVVPRTTYSPDLLELLLDDLGRKGMELPHLQIICTRLCQTLPAGQTEITLNHYKQLGGVEGILGGYLTEALDTFPDRQRVIANEVLKALVSSVATKRVLDKHTLSQRVKARLKTIQSNGEDLEQVLTSLVNARLLQESQETSPVQYEMAHDYLVKQVEGWLDREEMAVKQAEELLARELANWRTNQTLMSSDHLRVVADQANRMAIEPEAYDFLLASALKQNYDVTYWLKQQPDRGRTVTSVRSFLLGDDRQQAYLLADSLWPEGQLLDKALQPLVTQITAQLTAGDSQCRQRAREIQVFIGPVKQPITGYLKALQTGLQLLIPGRWSTILILALGGALGGLAAGLIQTFLGLIMGFIPLKPGLQSLLSFIVVNEPAMAGLVALIGIGLRFGTILARGRNLSLEIIGAALGGAMGGFLMTFYYLLLIDEVLSQSGFSLPGLFLDRVLLGTIGAIAIVLGMRMADKWNKMPVENWGGLIIPVIGAVVVTTVIAAVRDVLFGIFPEGTITAVLLSACFATGIRLAEMSAVRK